jgi:hypothetical protein
MTLGVKLRVPSALFVTLSCFVPAGANELGVGTGVLCDTAAQTARYAAVLEGDAERAIHTVNAESNATSCRIARVAFIRGKEVARARSKDTGVAIVEILVVGIVTSRGIDRIPPLSQFTLFTVEEQSV